MNHLKPQVLLDQWTPTLGAATQPRNINLGKLEPQYGGKWAYIDRLWIKAAVTVDQPATGGTAIEQADFGRMLASAKLHSHVLGQLYSNDITGPLLYLLIGPMNGGHGYDPTYLRGTDEIAAADGDYVRYVEWSLPFADYRAKRPYDTCPPTCCFRPNDFLELVLAANTVFDGISSGAVWQDAVFYVGADLVLSKSLYYPAVRRWNLMSGQGQTKMPLNLGAAEDLWALSNQHGLTGAAALNNYLTWTMTKGEVYDALNAEFLTRRFIHNNGGYPSSQCLEFLEGETEEDLTAYTGLTLNATTLALPVLWKHKRQPTGQLVNFGGSCTMTVTQTAAQDSLFLASEYDEWTEESVAKVADAFGLHPGEFSHRPKLDRPSRDGQIMRGKTRYLPRSIVRGG
jgi:hypothetical protein